MVRENSPQSHSPGVNDCLNAKIAETSMTVDDFDTFADDDVPKDGEEREDSWKGRLSIDDEEWHVVDFDAVGQVTDTCPTSVGMCYDNHLVSSVDKFLAQVLG